MTTPTAPRADASETDFADLGVPRRLVEALGTLGVVSPFPIQRATLPDALRGRDVIARGRTGSGKTIAFALPLIARLAGDERRSRPMRPRALVLVPTRELATQVAETFAPLARASKLRVTTIFGGVTQGRQVEALKSGVDVVVACPGRLEDLMSQRFCHLDDVEITVLDEADHMADLGFLPVVKRILDRTPGNGQRMLFSATLDNGVDVLVNRYLHDPVLHSVDPATAAVPVMTHHVLAVERGDKAAVVRELAGGRSRTLLFTRTKHTAKKLAAQLTKDGIPAVELHGNLSQGARTRNLEAFSEGRSVVLVATDIAARGIHVDDISLVVHVDPPAEHKAYLHRSGRTARAGAEGTVVTVMTPDQRRDVEMLSRAAGIRPTTTSVGPTHPLLRELAGPAADRVEPVPVSAAAPVRTSGAPRRGASSGPRNGGRGRASGSPSGNGNANGTAATRTASPKAAASTTTRRDDRPGATTAGAGGAAAQRRRRTGSWSRGRAGR